MVRIVHGAGLLVLLFLPLQALAGGSTWTGKILLLKGDKDVKIGFSDAKGNNVYVATLNGISYRVLADQAGFVKVAQNGVEGWFKKDQAVALDDAVDYFTVRLKAKPADDQAFGYRAEARLLKQDYQEAVKDLSEAIRLKPTLAVWWSNRAYVRSLIKDFDNALKDCNEAVRLDPSLARAFQVRGDISRAKKEADKALADYAQALKLEPKYVSAFYGRANAQWDLKNYAGAVKDFDEVLRLQANHEDALNELAWILATCPDDKVRDGKRAVALAITAVKLSAEKNPDHLDTLAAAEAEAGNFAEAAKRQKQALALAPLPAEVREAFLRRLKLYEEMKKFRDE